MKLPLSLLGLVLLGVAPSIAAKAAPCDLYGKGWEPYNNRVLGIELCRPPKLVVQTVGRDIYILSQHATSLSMTLPELNRTGLLLNGNRVLGPNGYVAHIKVGRGDFAAANNAEQIFVKDRGEIRGGIGRFNNDPAQPIRVGGWAGYQSTIICSTTDAETGFHAASGMCLWVVASDGQHSFVLDTLGDPANASTASKIARSLRFSKTSAN